MIGARRRTSTRASSTSASGSMATGRMSWWTTDYPLTRISWRTCTRTSRTSSGPLCSRRPTPSTRRSLLYCSVFTSARNVHEEVHAARRLFGSYEALKSGSPSEAMVDFTGGLTELIDLGPKQPADLFTIMLKAVERCALMACSIEVRTLFLPQPSRLLHSLTSPTSRAPILSSSPNLPGSYTRSVSCSVQ